MIRTKDLEEFIDSLVYSSDYYEESFDEYRAEIVARLERYDKLCHDLRQLIARLSNEVDK